MDHYRAAEERKCEASITRHGNGWGNNQWIPISSRARTRRQGKPLVQVQQNHVRSRRHCNAGDWADERMAGTQGAGGFEKFWTQKNFLPIIRQSKTAAIWFVFCLASQTKLVFLEAAIFLKVWPKEDRTEIDKTLTLKVLTLFDFFTYATFDSHFNPQIKAFTRGKKKLN